MVYRTRKNVYTISAAKFLKGIQHQELINEENIETEKIRYQKKDCNLFITTSDVYLSISATTVERKTQIGFTLTMIFLFWLYAKIIIYPVVKKKILNPLKKTDIEEFFVMITTLDLNCLRAILVKSAICTTFRSSKENEAELKEMQIKLELHQRRADMKREIIYSQRNNNKDVLSFDLQQALPIPDL